MLAVTRDLIPESVLRSRGPLSLSLSRERCSLFSLPRRASLSQMLLLVFYISPHCLPANAPANTERKCPSASSGSKCALFSRSADKTLARERRSRNTSFRIPSVRTPRERGEFLQNSYERYIKGTQNNFCILSKPAVKMTLRTTPSSPGRPVVADIHANSWKASLPRREISLVFPDIFVGDASALTDAISPRSRLVISEAAD